MTSNNIINLISEEKLKDVRLFSLEGLETEGRVVYCIDGDSLKMVFSHEGSVFQWNCRLFGIDTPEIRTKNVKEKELAYKAKERLEEIVLGRTVSVKCYEFDKFGRVLVEIFVDSDNVTESPIINITESPIINVTEKLISEGLGRPYSGGKKEPWFVNDN